MAFLTFVEVWESLVFIGFYILWSSMYGTTIPSEEAVGYYNDLFQGNTVKFEIYFINVTNVNFYFFTCPQFFCVSIFALSTGFIMPV